jgi:hypothetical protein
VISPSGTVTSFAAFYSASVPLKSRLPHSERRFLASAGYGFALSPHGAGSFNFPRFLGRVPFQEGDLDHCWYCAGMLKIARAFFADTSEKHASPAPARTADHSLRTCRKFKTDMLDLARSFLKPARAPRAFAAVVNFADLPPGLLASQEIFFYDV